MDDNNNNHNSSHFSTLSPLPVATIVVASIACALVIYHLFVIRCCSGRGRGRGRQFDEQLPSRSPQTDHHGAPSSVQRSFTELMPTYNYSVDIGSISKSSDGTCSICLSEFKDGEAIRLLPDCLHTFHVPCIDTWLVSHSSCPLCRADTPVRDVVGNRAPNV